LFEDFTHVKFYRLSLKASVELNAGQFDDGFHHVDDWAPQRLVTATGPNPLPLTDFREECECPQGDSETLMPQYADIVADATTCRSGAPVPAGRRGSV
jgi:hypothetical protein